MGVGCFPGPDQTTYDEEEEEDRERCGLTAITYGAITPTTASAARLDADVVSIDFSALESGGAITVGFAATRTEASDALSIGAIVIIVAFGVEPAVGGPADTEAACIEAVVPLWAGVGAAADSAATPVAALRRAGPTRAIARSIARIAQAADLAGTDAATRTTDLVAIFVVRTGFNTTGIAGCLTGRRPAGGCAIAGATFFVAVAACPGAQTSESAGEADSDAAFADRAIEP